MKKVFVILSISIMLLMSGCEEKENINESNNTTSEEQSETMKEIYWKRVENLGMQKSSTIQLESNTDRSGLKLVIDEYQVNLENEKEIMNENYNFTKMIKNDFDKDGIMEIILLFFGGSGGTYQDFRMIKFNGEKWEVVSMDLDDVNRTSFVKVKALKNNFVQIDVENTDYEEIVKLSKNKYLAKEGEQAIIGVSYRFFELYDNEIIVADRLYIKSVGNAFGDVRQRIRLDEKGTKLILGETSYIPIKEAQKRSYEIY